MQILPILAGWECPDFVVKNQNASTTNTNVFSAVQFESAMHAFHSYGNAPNNYNYLLFIYYLFFLKT